MADGSGQAVQHRLGLSMTVGMTVGMIVIMVLVMVVIVVMIMGMENAVAMVMINEIVFGMFHCWPPENGLRQSYTLP